MFLFFILCSIKFISTIRMIYAGNRVLNFNNLVLVVFISVGAGFFIADPNNNISIIIIPVAFVVTAAEAFYFEITMDELITKNYLIPFLNFRYALNEITLVQLMEPGMRSTADAAVKIIRGDKRSIGVKAASLRIKDWQLFVNELSERKIPVQIDASRLQETIGIPED
jgi:hypothetical protein